MVYSTSRDAIEQAITPLINGFENEFDVAGLFAAAFRYVIPKDEAGRELADSAGFEQALDNHQLAEALPDHRWTAYYTPGDQPTLTVTTPAIHRSGGRARTDLTPTEGVDVDTATRHTLAEAGWQPVWDWEGTDDGAYTAALQRAPSSAPSTITAAGQQHQLAIAARAAKPADDSDDYARERTPLVTGSSTTVSDPEATRLAEVRRVLDLCRPDVGPSALRHPVPDNLGRPPARLAPKRQPGMGR